jgi:5'(3')-deoxyribonucleotidase
MEASDESGRVERLTEATNRLGLTLPLVVAVDIDGVLADQVPHVLSRAKREFGVSMEKTEITAWDTRVADIPFDQLIARYLLDPSFVMTMPEMPRAKEALAVIRSRAKVIVGSSRPVETEKETILWLREHFDFDESQFINTALTGKAALPADILIDDNLDNVGNFVRTKDSKFAILLSQPWNWDRSHIRSLIEDKKIIIKENWSYIRNFFER